MRIVATIAEQAALKGLPFLVIGGNAVIAYGFQRQTVDVDLMVRDTDRRAWDELIVALGYRAHQIQRVFHMYNPTARDRPAVDLMLVDAQTFSKITEDTTSTTMDGAQVRIPALRNLIALKLHALRHGGEHRRARDLLDVIELVQINRVDLASDEYANILQRYASSALVAEIQGLLAGPRSSGP